MAYKDLEKKRESRRKAYYKNLEANKKKARDYYWENRDYILKQKAAQRADPEINKKIREQRNRACKKWRDKRRRSGLPTRDEKRFGAAYSRYRRAIRRLERRAQREVEEARQAGLAAKASGRFEWNGEDGRQDEDNYGRRRHN